MMFNKKQFQDEVRKALDPPKSVKIDTDYLKVGDIILHSKEPHKILTKDVRWSRDHQRKMWYGEVMDLTTGENVPYQFTWSYSAIKLPVFTEADVYGCEWAFDVYPTKDTTAVDYVWWNDNKFVVSVN